VFLNLGVALAKEGRPKEAEAALREALRLDPQMQDAARFLNMLTSGKGE
jgi:Flp pilus assembly protein TadD